MKRFKILMLALLFSALTACGGGNEGYGGGPGNTNTPPGGEDGPTGEGTTPPQEITIGSVVLTQPNDAIVDNEDGTYSLMFTVMVRDQDGSPATNGVRVDLQVVDTVIAMGTITDLNADTASGTSLTIPSVVDGENNGVDLTTAFVTRPGLAGGSIRMIQANDLVIMTGPLETVTMSGGPALGQVDSRDVVRTVASVPTISDQLTVGSLYNASYPNYGGTNYYISASMFGAGITGEDAEGVPTQSHTVTTDSLGTAKIWVTYPADLEHIMTGCGGNLDIRVDPLGSSIPMLVASTGGISNVRPFCFEPIIPFRLSATPNSRNSDGPVTVCVRDAGNGNGVRVPFYPVTAGTSGVATTTYVPNVNLFTNEFGCITFNLTITGNPGDSGTFTVYAGEGSVSVATSIPN